MRKHANVATQASRPRAAGRTDVVAEHSNGIPLSFTEKNHSWHESDMTAPFYTRGEKQIPSWPDGAHATIRRVIQTYDAMARGLSHWGIDRT